MNRTKKISLLVLSFSLFIGLLFAMCAPAQATIDPVPDHITNIDNLFAVPEGSDSQLPVNGVTVINTADKNQSGAIWAKDANKIDLTSDFSATMLLNFGDSQANAADGMAFVMHNDSRKTNTIQKDGNGQQLGVWAKPLFGDKNKTMDLTTAIQQSFAVEFDTFNNDRWDASSFRQNYEWLTNDPTDFSTGAINGNHIAYGFPARADAYDIGINRSGLLIHSYDYTSVLKHNGLYQSPTALSDGHWHEFTVNWSAAKKTLTYKFDKNSPVVVTIDPMTIFGTTSVDWGFTGKTGGSTEKNQVAFKSVSNIPTTSQDYKIYHKNVDGSQGAEVTATNPAKPQEKLLGVITANVASTSAPWKQIAVRYRNVGTDTNQGIGYVSGDGVTINGQNVSTSSGTSTGLFKTPNLALDGSTLIPRNATDNDLFGTGGQYPIGINSGDIAAGKQSVIKLNLMAMDPTATDGLTNLGRDVNVRLDGGTASEVTTLKTYVTSIPSIELSGDSNNTTQDKPMTVEKNSMLNLTGTWKQSSITGILSSAAKGTLHYSIDDGIEQTIAQQNTGGNLVTGISTTGLTMNAPHKLTVYMTNAGYNEKSEVKTIYFQIKGGKLQFTKVNDPISFNSVVVGQNVTATRKGTDWAPTVSDSRGKGGHWDLYASSTGLTRTSDQKALAGGLIYVNGQSTKNITSTPIIVASKDTTTDNDEVTKVDWSSDQGILLKVGADAYKGDYSGTINWTLGNTPKP